MAGFIAPITIKTAIDKIDNNDYLIPAIQRKFVWKSYQIEVLFDSIMRGYPINSFMFWEIKDASIKDNFKFYSFLTQFVQFHQADNIPRNTVGGFKDFYAIIDGQQRLTSLYIGLRGSYAYKTPNARWEYSEKNFPTRHLYLNLASPLPIDNERKMVYDFRFLTKDELDRLSKDPDARWYKVGDILKFAKNEDIWDYVIEQGWAKEEYTRSTLLTLHKRIFEDKSINYYLEDEQRIDRVLDIFIRTNSGGTTLSFSNLLMSIITANWVVKDARDEFEKLIKKVYRIGKSYFVIDSDLILKTCLVLLGENIKFKVANLDKNVVCQFENNWDKISNAITDAFTLLDSWHFNESNFKAKNAIIPLVYYIYHNDIKDINNPIRHTEEKSVMRKWLCMSLLKRVFGGQTDTVLGDIRKVLKTNIGHGYFPLDEIKEAFKSSPSKNLSFTEDYINILLDTEKEHSDCFAILSLLYPHLDYSQDFDKDHMHPEGYFRKLTESKTKESWMSDDDYAFYTNARNWNTIQNLQLLHKSLNRSKQEQSLADWIKEKNINPQLQLIPPQVSLDIKDFKEFVEKRRELLKNSLVNMVGGITSEGTSSLARMDVMDEVDYEDEPDYIQA